jgi:hypothetical protein
MASKFDDILAQGIRAGQIPARTQSARDWFRNKARDTSTTPEAVVRGERARYKAELPYYDRYPLIFPVQGAPGGFYGINMHYLPYRLRAQLMDALYELSSNKRYDENTKLRLSYEVLKGASKYKLFKPTFKRYLSGHVRSRFVEISSSEWDIALFLPLESFAKASKSSVWADSRRMAR